MRGRDRFGNRISHLQAGIDRIDVAEVTIEAGGELSEMTATECVIRGLCLAAALTWASSTNAACSGSGLAWNCTAGSTVPDVQRAVNDAADGATIGFAAGSYSWANPIMLSNGKGITLQGTGVGQTIVDVVRAPIILMSNLSGNNTKTYRITGFTFQNAYSDIVIWLHGSGTLNNIRIDHNKFANFATGVIAIHLGEIHRAAKFYGVIDHNMFSGSTNFLSLKYLGPIDPGQWPSSLQGTAHNIFLEDNTYNFAKVGDFGQGCVDVWNAGALVFRYNSVTNCLVTAHGTSHNTTVNFELYRNTLQRTAGSGGIWDRGYRSFQHQGSGEILIWDNKFQAVGPIVPGAIAIRHYRSAAPDAAGYPPSVGRCNGEQPRDGNFAPLNTYFGYPCWMQPGRAPAGGSPVFGTLSPIYAWMNVDQSTGSKVPIAIENPWKARDPSVANHIKADRDYYDAVSNQPQTSPTKPFNGTSGMGFGTLANRPTTCTTSSLEPGGGVGYWATDTNTLYRCSATNVWTTHYQPYTYPHPLQEH